jgi:hypothetical protein
LSEFNGESLQVELETEDDDAKKINEAIQKIKRFFKWINKKFHCFFLKKKKKQPSHKNTLNGNNSSRGDFISNQPQNLTIKSNEVCFGKSFDKKYCKCFYSEIWRKISLSVHTFVSSKYFELFIIIVIVLSSAALVIEKAILFYNIYRYYLLCFKAMEDKFINEKPYLKYILSNADYVFTAIFTIEMILLWISYGFRQYFTNGWCLLDFIIVLVLNEKN